MLKDYVIELHKDDIESIDKEVADKGVEECLNQQLRYLDATRTTSNGMRPEQTISHVYMYDVSKYLYIVNKFVKEHIDDWINKLTQRHEDNLAYEKDNPPIVYDTRKINKYKRIRKAKEGIIPGFEQPKKVRKPKTSKAEARLAKIQGLNIKLKLIKGNETV